MFYQLPLMGTSAKWHELYRQVLADGHNFVVIDNLAQTLHGSVNDDAVVRQFFEGVRLFVRAGIPVVVIAHSSDKSGQNGFKSELPMGSAYMSQAVRWRVFVRRSRRGNVTLKFMGNHSEPYEMTLSHGAGARFEVLDVKSPEAVKSNAEGNARQRTQAKLNANAEVARWVVANGQGLTQRELAAKLAANLGIGVEAARKRIARSPVTQDGTTWALSVPE